MSNDPQGDLSAAADRVEQAAQEVRTAAQESMGRGTDQQAGQAEDLESLNVDDLKARLRQVGEPVSGTKSELVERLQAANATQGQQVGGSDATPRPEGQVADAGAAGQQTDGAQLGADAAAQQADPNAAPGQQGAAPDSQQPGADQG